MTNPDRPLSPHLSVYRWPITMTLSILHRATGVALSLGLLAMTAWLVSAAGGGESYGQFAELAGSWYGKVLLFGWAFAFFFHLANGVRHLVWDAGFGFEKHQANASAWAVLIFTVIASIGYWVLVT
ncbi:MAG: succinate dehydrogenase, cytochrome b556 subunit [Gammaproteobacteria bacterium]|nr:succinate dehydrogenase, cytochrome b556 subunit [Gammaproteobacteria bacterium]